MLEGIISQRLIPKIKRSEDGKLILDKETGKPMEAGRVAAMEILVKTPTIEKLIHENRDYEIKDAIEKGREHYNSQSFDQHIFDIHDKGLITKERAMDFATSASDLELKMSGLNTGKGDMRKSGVAPSMVDEDIFELKS